MPRPYRLSAPGFHHHVTQRGNFRQDVFRTPADHLIFLDQLQQAAALEGCLIHAYCLMSNHFHLLLHPLLPTSLSRTLQRASSGYARLLNLRLHRRGHVWQARFYSSPIEPTHVPRVIRYIERNPITAQITAKVENYPYSSAPPRLGIRPPEPWLRLEPMPEAATPAAWHEYLLSPLPKRETAEIRRALTLEKPYGSASFVKHWPRAYPGLETAAARYPPTSQALSLHDRSRRLSAS